MKHNFSISVSQKPKVGGIVSCQRFNIRARLLNRLLGEMRRVTVIVPGDSVESLSISEIGEEGGYDDEQNQTPSRLGG